MTKNWFQFIQNIRKPFKIVTTPHFSQDLIAYRLFWKWWYKCVGVVLYFIWYTESLNTKMYQLLTRRRRLWNGKIRSCKYTMSYNLFRREYINSSICNFLWIVFIPCSPIPGPSYLESLAIKVKLVRTNLPNILTNWYKIMKIILNIIFFSKVIC